MSNMIFYDGLAKLQRMVEAEKSTVLSSCCERVKMVKRYAFLVQQLAPNEYYHDQVWYLVRGI